MTPARELPTDEAGMTLIEMVIAIALLGIIVGPIVFSMLLSLLETNSTRDRIADSSSAQVLSAFLLADIQSSQVVSKTKSDCKPASLASGTVVLQLNVLDPVPQPAGTAKVVSYIDHIAAGGQHQLYRAECGPAGASDSTLLAQHVATSGGFVVKCDGALTCPDTPKVVTVDVIAQSLEPDDQSSYGPFAFKFTVTRRVGT